jgi:HSF-type DNA-binding
MVSNTVTSFGFGRSGSLITGGVRPEKLSTGCSGSRFCVVTKCVHFGHLISICSLFRFPSQSPVSLLSWRRLIFRFFLRLIRSRKMSTQVALTNIPPQRCVSVVSSQGSGSSDNSVCSGSESMECNPFMALVDAATSLLDRRADAACISPLTSKIPLAVEVASTPTPFQDIKAPNKCKEKYTFSHLLKSVLDDPAHEDVITWMPDGMAFTIVNHKRFTMELMPKIFNIRNMSSFVRKLGRWGFNRVHEKETRNSDIFKHKDFQKGNSERCKAVKCVGRLTGSKPSPPPSCKKVIGLVNTDGTSTPSHSPVTMETRSPSITARIPCPPNLVTPTSDRALLRLEHARRLSAHTRPSVFRDSGGLRHMTNEVVGAAIETLRRDEETVIVAMPKRYLHSTHAPPGLRVLSSRSSFMRQVPQYLPHHPHHPRHPHPHALPPYGRRPSYQRPRGRSSLVMTPLNTRPTQSRAAPPGNAAAHPMMMPQRGWALKRATSQPRAEPHN